MALPLCYFDVTAMAVGKLDPAQLDVMRAHLCIQAPRSDSLAEHTLD